MEASLDGRAAPWQYALARFHFADLRAAYRGRDVWHVEAMPSDVSTLEIGTAKYQDSVYATYHTQTTPVEEP